MQDVRRAKHINDVAKALNPSDHLFIAMSARCDEEKHAIVVDQQ